MAYVWKESKNSLKYLKVYENKSFGCIHLFLSTMLILDGYWIDIGKKEEDKHEDCEKKVERRVHMMKVVYKYIKMWYWARDQWLMPII
jgi:hypothetical protein